MDERVMERILRTFEKIAGALEDLSVIQHRRYIRDYPERKEPRDLVLTHVKTEEDIVKERQGNSDEPLDQWLGGYEEPEYIGARERAFLEEERKRNASASIQPEEGSGTAGSETVRSKVGRRRKRTGSNAVNENG